VAGQAATVFDPTLIIGETTVSEGYELWVRENNLTDPALIEKLRPSGLMQSLGMKSLPPAERQRAEFYDLLPDRVTARTPPALREMVEAKQRIRFEAMMMMHEAINNGLIPGPAQAPAHIEKERRLSELQQSFARLYEQGLADGTVDRYMAQEGARAFIADPRLSQRPAPPRTMS
jgi:hypothetical protein